MIKYTILILLMSVSAYAQAFVLGLNDAAHHAGTIEAGVKSIRMSHGHGKTQGQMDSEVDWAASRGLGVMLFLGYSHQPPNPVGNPRTPEGRQQYAERSANLVRRYGGKVQYYEVWNEWNGGLGLGRYPACLPYCRNGAMYADLLCRTYKAIKAARPEAIVVGGATAGTDPPFITAMMNAGAGKCMDKISVHPYPYVQAAYHHVPFNAPASQAVGKFMFAVNEVDAIVRSKHGSSIKFLISEEGRQGTGAASEKLTSDYFSLLYKTISTDPRIEGMWWFNLVDNVALTGGTYGMIRENGGKKPVFFAFKAAAAGGPVTPPTPPTPPPPVEVSPDGASIPPLSLIGDQDKRAWTLIGGRPFLDGAPVPGSSITLLLKHSGVIYQRNIAGGWWKWINGAWIGATDPGAPVVTPPPPPPPVTPPPAASMLCENGVDAQAVGGGVMLKCHE